MTMTDMSTTEAAVGPGEPGSDTDPLRVRVREVVRKLVPAGGKVYVVAKMDDKLLRAAGDNAAPFPEGEDGRHAGYYPGSSAEAVEMLTAARRRGATHLLFPGTSFWWLEHYEAFRRHLGLEHTCVWRDERCALYQLAPLGETSDATAAAPAPSGGASADELAYWQQQAEQRARRVQQLEQTVDSLYRRAETQAGIGNVGEAERANVFAFDIGRLVQFPDVEPIFVLGASRSGTTAMGDAVKRAMKCFGWLEGHLFHLMPPVLSAMKRSWDQLQQFEHPCNGLRALDHYDFYAAINRTAETFHQLYLERTRQSGAARWLDKTPEPQTIFAVPVLAHMYPRATFIYMHRHPIKRALSFLKKFEEYKEATMEMAFLSWKACMDGWVEARKALRPASYMEFRQDDLTGKTDEVIARLASLLSMTPEQQAVAKHFFLTQRPQFTGSSRDEQEVLLEDVDWPEEFKRWCVSACGATAAAWGYRLSRS
jgi:hypothetical protein